MNNFLLTVHLVFNVALTPVEKIDNMIKKINPSHSDTTRLFLAYTIYKSAQKWDIDPIIMAKLIQIESHFKLTAKSNTGDYSLVQINCDIWAREFKRMGRRELNCGLLVKSPSYALDRMAEILSIVKSRTHSKHWYLGYHSGTRKLRLKYLKKLRKIN